MCAVKRRMPNYEAYLDRFPEVSYATTGLRLAFRFLLGQFNWFTKLEVCILQSLHSEIVLNRQQAMVAKTTIDANEHNDKILNDIT